jgi:hypothetical protein
MPSVAEHGPQELAAAGPEDLQAEAEQNEGRESHRDVRAPLAEQGLDAIGVSKRQENSPGDHDDCCETCTGEDELVRAAHQCRMGESEADDHRNGPRAPW